MNNIPAISIIIPAYNRAEVISETLDSVLAQSFQNWECIIVDDGSKDNTFEIAAQYTEKDSRFRLYKRPDSHKPGGCGARNFGFLQSKGKYIKWLDSDDIIEKELLKKEIQQFEQQPGLKFAYCGHLTFHKTQSQPNNAKLIQTAPKTGTELLNLMGASREYVLTGSYAVDRNVISVSGLWNEELKINQDGEFIFRVLTNCDSVASVDYNGFRYRIDNSNKITSGYNDKEKVRLKLKSWLLIDEQIKTKNIGDLEPYISGTKDFLYKYHLHQRHYDIVAEFKDFFKKQIKEEKRKRIRLKLIPLLIKQRIRDFFN